MNQYETKIVRIVFYLDENCYYTWSPCLKYTTQSRIIGAVRGAHSQLWGTITPVYSLYAARKYDMRFGTPAIVRFTGWS